MTLYDTQVEDIVPAHLRFLAIFSPDLGQSEKTEHDQIVFYWSRSAKGRKQKKQDGAEQLTSQAAEEEHERMRQIGLAQGMVSFARTFGGGKDIDSIDTERHRIILKQLEKGWWILGSICLTRMPSQNAIPSDVAGPNTRQAFDYSSREVSPSLLLLEQLLRANRIFLLHHASTISDLYVRLSRTKFCGILNDYWTRFAKGWNVMLHGNPALDVYHATRLPAAGELGVGVGEEDWGSGEREALEGLVRDTEGLVDLIVYRHDTDEQREASNERQSARPTNDEAQQSHDLAKGAVFSGSGKVTQASACTVAEWLQHVAEHPTDAYGVRDNPASARRKLPRTPSSTNADTLGTEIRSDVKSAVGGPEHTSTAAIQDDDLPRAPIPPSIMSVIEESLDKATSSADAPTTDRGKLAPTTVGSNSQPWNSFSGSNWTKVLKLGYGSSWGPTGGPHTDEQPPILENKTVDSPLIEPGKRQGQFLIGLAADLYAADEECIEQDENSQYDGNRIIVRTIYVEVSAKDDLTEPQVSSTRFSTQDEIVFNDELAGARLSRNIKRMRIILYKSNPFICAFIFDPNTASLALESFYRILHRQFQAIHKSLDASTSPRRVVERMASAIPDDKYQGQNHVLVYDSAQLTVRTTIPRVPPPFDDVREQIRPYSWTRLDALNVYIQTLSCIAESRLDCAPREMSAETQRHWWIVWSRQRAKLHQTNETVRSFDPEAEERSSQSCQEFIFLRKLPGEATKKDHKRVTSLGRLSLSGSPPTFNLGKAMGRESSGGDQDMESSSDTSTLASKVVGGMNMDPRKYVEALFQFNR